MPQLTIEPSTADSANPPARHQVEIGTRLVLAIRDAGVAIGHRCGGHAKCTTCRVEVLAGEPSPLTRAESDKLEAAGLEGVRLSCQMTVQGDLTVRPLMTLDNQPWSDTGPEPDAEITPPPVWLEEDPDRAGSKTSGGGPR